jgi:hypothetical protein
MSEPGINTDQSQIRPSRRADLPPQVSIATLGKKPPFGRLRNMFRDRRVNPRAEHTIDYTVVEGDPTYRADVDLPLDLCAVSPA